MRGKNIIMPIGLIILIFSIIAPPAWAASCTMAQNEAWSKITDRVFSQIVIDPQTPTVMYAIGNMYSIQAPYSDDWTLYKSVDAGRNWQVLHQVVRPATTYKQIICSLVIEPYNSANMYISYRSPFPCPLGFGVSKSTDYGATWSEMIYIGTPDCDPSYCMLAIDPQHPATVYWAIGGEDELSYIDAIYKSTDGGTTWNKISGVAADFMIAIDPCSPGTIYIATFDGLAKSTDDGVHWSMICNDSCSQILIDPQRSAILYTYKNWGGGFFKSVDGGNSWRQIWTEQRQGGPIAIDPNSPNILYAGIQESSYPQATAKGVFKSEDGGEHWSAYNVGLSDLNVKALAIDPLNSNIVYAVTLSGVFVAGPSLPTAAVTARVPAGHGRVSPADQDVRLGSAASIAIIPDAGYHIAAISDNGINMVIANPYVIAHVTAAHNVTVTLANAPPQVQITQPQNGTTVYGTVAIAATAMDDMGIDRVDLRIDGAVFQATALGQNSQTRKRTVQAPYSWQWPTVGIANGSHTLRATAFDQAGASSSASVQVNVQNVIIHLSGQRLVERTWLLRKQFAALDIAVENIAAIPVASYDLLRQTGTGDFAVLHTFRASELAGGQLTYYDAYLDKSQSYSYKVQAYDSKRMLVGQSATVVLPVIND